MIPRVAIAGVGELPQGRSALPHTMALHEQLARLALDDAGIALDEVDALLTVAPRSDPYLIHAAGVAEHLGIAPAVTWTLEAGGAGDGRWNLDRYHVALSADVPLGRLNIRTLGGEDATAKGIAEAVLCPIAPAIGNAIAHATGRRFRSLPITTADIKEALS